MSVQARAEAQVSARSEEIIFAGMVLAKTMFFSLLHRSNNKEGKKEKEMKKALTVLSATLVCVAFGCGDNDGIVPCSQEGIAQGVVYVDDLDCDGVPNEVDNCMFVANGEGTGNQADRDGDTVGDTCDPFDDRECLTSAGCDDHDSCTVDLCEVGHLCQHIPSDDPACEPEQPECTIDADCSEFNTECLIFRCLANYCFAGERDEDGDGHVLCGGLPSGYYDCDDRDPNVFPGADETCDGRDNDCDGETDEGVTETRYRDEDGDGYGDPEFSGVVCVDAPPVEGARVPGDCNDHDAAINPSADETCDELDNDCDGELNEGLLDCPINCIGSAALCDCGENYGVAACNSDGTTGECQCPVCGDGVCLRYWPPIVVIENHDNCPEDCDW